MAHWVNKLDKGGYQVCRKSGPGKLMYMARTPNKGGKLEDARVFNNRRAAQNSLNHAKLKGFPALVILAVAEDYN